MKLKKLLLIFTIFVVFIGINAASAADSGNIDDAISSISNESVGSDSSILKINEGNQKAFRGNIIVINAEDNHNEMDDPTIQPAINNANANDTIIITGKSYVHCHFVVDKPLTIISNVSTSMTPCPSNSQGSGYRGIFYIAPEASGTVIEGFTINNNMVSGENDYGVLIRGASDVIIRNCEIISSASADAVRVENAKNTLIENISVNSPINAIRIKNSQDTVVNNSNVKNSNIGVNLIESVQTVLEGNVITSNKASGIYIDDKTSKTTIFSNNITNNNGKGIDAASANGLNVLNNYIAFNKNGESGAGIYINCDVDDLVIKGNVLQENGNYAILYDYRVRNIGPDGLGENVASVDYNYIFGHTDRAIYHITYNKDSKGSFIYDADNDEYTAVGYGNGDYSISMTTAYLGYSYLINEQLCPSIFFTWGKLWSAGNYRLTLSNISQINKGVYEISVADPNGDIAKDLSSVYVTFYLNKNDNKPTPQEGDVYKTVLIQNGTATARFYADDFNEKDNVLTVSFPGNNPTLTGNPYKRFDIPDSEIPSVTKETTLTLSNLTTYPNSGEYVIANLKDSDGYALSGKNITFVIDSQRYVVGSDGQGNARFKASIAKEGAYDLTATFEGDDIDYFGSEAQSTVVVRKVTTIIESEDYYVVPGISDSYSITLKDESGDMVSYQDVTFNLDGNDQIVTTDSQGKASLKVSFKNNNTDYKVTVTYPGSDKYVGCSNSSFIYVRYSSKDVELVVPFVNSLPNDKINYTVTLKGFNGRIHKNELLVVNIDGVEYKKKTDSNGQVVIELQLSEIKDYEVVASYGGSKIYKSVTNSSYIRVAKADTEFVAQNMTVLPKVEAQISVALETCDGDSLSNQEFTYEIEGKKYSDVTDANGEAVISHKFSKEGLYPVELTYTGSDIYKDTSAIIYVNVKRITSVIESYDKTFSKGSSQNFTITLTDGDGNAMANQKVVFTVSGKNISGVTGSDGMAGINVASKAGSFDVKATYAGSDKYSPVSKTNKITVLNEGDIVYVDSGLPNSEIQRILDSCDDGDVVKFLGNSYENISLTVSKEISISPKGKTALHAKEHSPAFMVVADNTVISGFSIVANSGDGIDVDANGVKLKNNIITNELDSSKSRQYNESTIPLPGYGINVFDSVDVEIINNTISLFESGIFAEKSSELIIDENTLKENNYGIKYGFEVSDSEITNNLITQSIGLYTMEVPEGPRGYGIFLNNSAANVSIIGNVITWNHLGISIDANGSTGIVVTGNLITDSVLEGIRFNAGYDLAKDAVEPLITDNAIYRNARGPSMMILGEMSANPGGIYGPGEWDDDAKLHIDANWYGVNSLRTWNNDTGIVGIGTMCPRIKTYEIKFDTIVVEAPGSYSITLTKDGETASNLCEFDLYATLNKGTEYEQEVNFNVTNGVGQFSFDTSKFINDINVIDISVGSLNSQERVFRSFYTYRIKIDTNLSAVYNANTKELYISLIGANGQPIRGSNVAVSFDGKSQTVKTNYTGQVKVSVADAAPETTSVAISYAGSTKYNPSSITVDITGKLWTHFVSEDIFAEYGDVELTAVLVNDANGQAVKGATVGFKINGKSYKAKTDLNGNAKVTVSGLAPGNYSASVSYNGNTKYHPASETFTVAVNKITTRITAYYDSQSNEIVATLINEATGKGVYGGTVGIVLNNVKHLIKTDKQGQVRLSLGDVDPNTFKASVSYAGNAKYFGSVRVIYAAENKIATYISTVYDKQSNEIVATLINNATGQVVKGGTVGIVINNVRSIIKTDINGQAKVSVADLDVNAYSVFSSYSGNTKYAATSETKTFVKI
ncbi:right-handed parallel beta-helix repeat-containing protein [Methanobrevibacter sp.]|uniref:right-handed parallel beta-helix repeat-containing protein n=1 Tax=Methanobrevibacter sp. TaxID=66852 RepID=UPI003864611B